MDEEDEVVAEELTEEPDAAAEGEGEVAAAEGDGAPEGGSEDEPEPEAEPEATPRMVPYDRFAEVNGQARQAQATVEVLLRQMEQRQPRVDAPRHEVPEAFRELDKSLNPYMLHYLGPIAAAVQQMQAQFKDEMALLADEARFYKRNGWLASDDTVELPDGQRVTREQILESVHADLNRRFGKPGQPVLRQDALLYLRGHPHHGELFADPKAAARAQSKRTEAEHVVARRQAGRVGGRAAGKVGGQREVNLTRMTPEERVKYFETEMANTPF